MNWNEKLCGHVVTPESWVRGIVAKWNVHSIWCELLSGLRICIIERDGYSYEKTSVLDSRPIFPPRGWAGLSEDEILAAVMPNPLESLDDDEVYATFEVYGKQNQFIDICLDGHLNAERIPPLIQALQNAQVLAARLREGRNDAS